MTRSGRMQPIKDLADSRARDAGSVVGAAQKLLQERELQLQKLRDYLADYNNKQSMAVGAQNAMHLQNHRAFLQRLADAIRQQEQSVQQAREDYERKRDAWRDRRVEANSLGRAIENLQTQERRVEDKREQAGMEEQADAQRRIRELTNESGTWKVGNTGKWKVDN
jgi:flagellar FliJ protein